jgi:hypothetical protein
MAAWGNAMDRMIEAPLRRDKDHPPGRTDSVTGRWNEIKAIIREAIRNGSGGVGAADEEPAAKTQRAQRKKSKENCSATENTEDTEKQIFLCVLCAL